MNDLRPPPPAVSRPDTAGLYVHVPFCGSICGYCHFARTDRHDLSLRRRFTAALVRELDLRRRVCSSLQQPRRALATCYFGGGTPSVLEPALMKHLVAGTLGTLPQLPDIEVTAEANPESLTETLVACWLELGINRVSLGIQSLDDGVLTLLGRTCDAATARQALALACRRFRRVSADWILGPGVQRKKLLAELSTAVDLGVEHFSLYLLEIHPGTPLQQAVAEGQVAMPPDRELESLYLGAQDHLERLGIHQYEVANFARCGAESRHNRNYWRHKPYLGLGPGAHGFYGKLRYANTGQITPWLTAIEQGGLPPMVLDPLDRTARRLERMILALRTAAGVPLTWLPRGFDPGRGLNEGLWAVRKDRLVLTGRGFLRIDTIEEFLVGLTSRDCHG